MWYQYALLAACTFAWWQGGEALRRAAVVLLVNAAVVTGWFFLTGNNDNIELAAATDIVSAYVVMRSPAGKEQGWLGMTYAFQIGCHAAAKAMEIRGIGIPMIQPSYWELLHYAFLVQLGILIVWSEGHGGKLADAFRRLGRNLHDRPARDKAGVG